MRVLEINILEKIISRIMLIIPLTSVDDESAFSTAESDFKPQAGSYNQASIILGVSLALGSQESWAPGGCGVVPSEDEVLKSIHGSCSLVDKVADSWPLYHEFEPSTAEEQLYRGAMHVKPVVRCPPVGVVVGRGSDSSSVVLVT
ncbi:hypothetical protein TNCV_1696441 [Trichonephila clavipes]|nr:hypothetical protein TNCV_1696441 [Trichonephila clavipes]